MTGLLMAMSGGEARTLLPGQRCQTTLACSVRNNRGSTSQETARCIIMLGNSLFISAFQFTEVNKMHLGMEYDDYMQFFTVLL